MYIISSSCGNDSVALIQWAGEKGLKDVHVIYANTGWAHPTWPERVKRVDALCLWHGFEFYEATSEGMEALVRRKKGWPKPASDMQFCTQALKTLPFLALADEIDADRDAIVMVGVRREESEHRVNFPERVEDSEKHGGRDMWAPLVRHLEADRNQLIERAGFDVLPYRSKECSPCINANRADLRMLTPQRIDFIERIEKDLGLTSKGKPRTMFRPYRYMGATGIREVHRWAMSEHGKFTPERACDSGYCGD